MSALLEKYGRNRLSVTDIAQQFWCERQVVLSLEFPREETGEMAAGSAIHRDLMLELLDEVPVSPETAEDELYLMMHNIRTGLEQLSKEGRTRELYVCGRVGGLPVAGIIDEVAKNAGELTLLDHKTRTRPTLPPPPTFLTTEVQVMMYRRMLDDLRLGRYTLDDFLADRGLRGLGGISPGFREQLEAQGHHEKTLPGDLAAEVFELFRGLPAASDYVVIRYVHQGTGDHIGDRVVLYDHECLEGRLAHAMKLWKGERGPDAVKPRERWKCNYCEYRGVHCDC